MKRQGYAIPLSLVVAGVTLVLGMSAAQMSASDLSLASRQHQLERARQIADLGLEMYSYHLHPPASGAVLQGLPQNYPDDRVQLRVFDNKDGNLASDSGCPVEVPTGFEYWLATGEARSGTRVLATARMGTLVRPGLAVGSAGAQVRLLTAPSGVSYQAIDGDAPIAAPLLNETLCASNVSSAPTDLPSGQPTALAFGSPLLFQGNVKLPVGAAIDQIVDSPAVQLQTSASGGSFSLSEYQPPGNLPDRGSLTLSSGTTSLAPGRYQDLQLHAGSEALLSGTYYVERLQVHSPDALLRVAQGSRGRLFVDSLELQGADSWLNLQNSNSSARQFRLDLKPARQVVEQPLRLLLRHEGRVMVVAPGYPLALKTDTGNVVRGAFFAEHLRLLYPGSGSGKFLYDVSADAGRGSETGSFSPSPFPGVGNPNPGPDDDEEPGGGFGGPSPGPKAPRHILLGKHSL